jgi:hypothetical protein
MSRHKLIAWVQLFLSLTLVVGIWAALPARYALVDVVGSGLALSSLVAALGLFSSASWGVAFARTVAATQLVIGTLCVSALAMSVAQLAGAYGPVGSGGALLMGTIALLVVPYFVVLPALQLHWLRATG